MFAKHVYQLMILMVSLLVFPAGPLAASEELENSDVTSISRIEVSFKLDPRLTRSIYMGDRWVSPHTYTRIQSEETLVVEARAKGMDTSGKQIAIHPVWKTGNPAIVGISPTQGSEVKITVLSAGQTDLTLTYGKVSEKLIVTAKQINVKSLRVDISQ